MTEKKTTEQNMEETAAEMDVKQSAGKETKPADKKEQSKLTDERIAKMCIRDRLCTGKWN